MPRDLVLSLTAPQAEFANALDGFPAMVAGFGAGKTQALVSRALVRKVSFPAGWVGYYAPTYDLVNLIALPRFEEMLEAHKMPYRLNKSEMVLSIKRYGAVIFRTMEKPERIVGFEHADACIDELDTLKIAHATKAWNRIVARNREKKPDGDLNTVAVGTTPEGFNFVYDRWVRKHVDGGSYRLIHASTHSNEWNLPPGYIPSLYETYPANLLKAYIEGRFVNLTSGAVYPDFDRDLNRTKEKIEPGEHLHIGMDFNVWKMAGVVFVMRQGKPLALDEFANLRDTPAMIEAIKTRYVKIAKPHRITIYPDSSGANASSTSVSMSDMVLLREAKFDVDYPAANPPVKDRVASVNAQILNGLGVRALQVNIETCPCFTEALEQQVYNERTGEPDKKSGHDHPNDAGGYFLHRRFPVVKQSSQRVRLGGV